MLPFEAVDQNLREAMACYSYVCAQGEFREFSGVRLASSGIDYSVFNSVMLASAVESMAELERRITGAEVHFKARGLGRSYWICEDLLTPSLKRSTNDLFSKLGMKMIAEPPGMYAEEVLAPSRNMRRIEIRPVDDAKTRLHFVEIATAVFALPYRISEQIYGSASTWESGMKGYIGYAEKRPVSMVSTVAGGDAVGIYSLATLPDQQGCGYGETVMRFALNEARKQTGLTKSVLQTTKSGLRLYKRMGYKQVTKFRVYNLESCG